MSKQITAAELAEIVSKLLTGHAAELDSHEQFSKFMTDIANVVCDHCGGETRHPADNAFDEVWYIGIHGNDSLPSVTECIWSEYDKEGDLNDTEVGDKASAATD
ncbi:MAG: hypothetical protein Q8S02_16810 [Hydrogenophaga sp.]|nr:hypothetical protein [Hydrogenophaga sp.]